MTDDDVLFRQRRWYASAHESVDGISQENLGWEVWEKVGDVRFVLYDRRDCEDLIAVLRLVADNLPPA